MGWDIEVTLEDGRVLQLTGDQRDMAAWEAHPAGGSFEASVMKPYLFLRFMAWNAGRRTKVANWPSWDEFADACASVVDKTEREQEEPDPGQTAASAGT